MGQEPLNAARARVLVIEDAEEISDVIEAVLGAAGYELRVERTGPDGLAAATEWDPDVLVLDLNLPGLDGVEVCRRLRATSDAYVLMLTARTDEVDRIVGLSVGADDYVTKPFSPREIQARVQALLRRPRLLAGAGSGRVAAAPPEGVLIDLDTREVSVDGSAVTLTKLEFDLVAALTERPGHVLSRAQLRSLVWGGDWLADDHAVDVHISNLRRKLRAAGAGDRIGTVRGIGYRYLADTG